MRRVFLGSSFVFFLSRAPPRSRTACRRPPSLQRSLATKKKKKEEGRRRRKKKTSCWSRSEEEKGGGEEEVVLLDSLRRSSSSNGRRRRTTTIRRSLAADRLRSRLHRLRALHSRFPMKQESASPTMAMRPVTYKLDQPLPKYMLSVRSHPFPS